MSKPRPNTFEDKLVITTDSVSLRPLSVLDALSLPILMKDNQTDDNFNAEFPNVASRHSGIVQSLKSIMRTIRSDKVYAYTVRADETWLPSEELWHEPTSYDRTDYRPFMPNAITLQNRLEGLATIQRNVRIGNYAGSLIAGWVTHEARSQGVGSRAAELLMGKLTPGPVLAMTRPENEVATRIITKLGFEPVDGEPRDYSEQIGDGVTSPQQLYIFEKPVNGWKL